MDQEQVYGMAAWWNDQNFHGKELFTLEDDGTLKLTVGNIKERVISKLSIEDRDFVLTGMKDKFLPFELKIKELESEWSATEDKLKLADKFAHFRENLTHSNAVGNYEALLTVIQVGEQAIHEIIETNYQEKLKLAEEAEILKDSEKWKEAYQTFKDIAEKWKQLGYVERGRNDILRNRIETARKEFLERKKNHSDDEQKVMLQNLDLKIELVEKAEQLAKSEEWKETSEKFQQLTDEWKTIGQTLHRKNEELWQRLITAKNTFFDKKKIYFNEVKKEQAANYKLKLALVEKAEAMKDSTEWNATAQAYAGIMEEWKKIGRVPQDRSEMLWLRLTAAKDVFYEAKKKVSEETKQVLESNYNIKSDILRRAEAIKNSSNWGETTNEFNELMEEWKKSGPVPRALSNKIWEDFLAARKHFFERKDANREQKKQYEETQKVYRAEQDKRRADQVVQQKKDLLNTIKEEEENLADFEKSILNITPSKKAEELRRHLETLIKETKEKLIKLRAKAGITQNVEN